MEHLSISNSFLTNSSVCNLRFLKDILLLDTKLENTLLGKFLTLSVIDISIVSKLGLSVLEKFLIKSKILGRVRLALVLLFEVSSVWLFTLV